MKYFYRLSCPDCTGIDPQGCFDGQTYLSDPFDSPEEANRAAWKDTLRNIYTYEIEDETGRVLDDSEIDGNPWDEV